MTDLIALYRFAVVAGDRALAERLGNALRNDLALSSRADRELQELQRGEPRWSPGGERAARRALALVGRRTIEPE
jgi:hypothetical protein